MVGEFGGTVNRISESPFLAISFEILSFKTLVFTHLQVYQASESVNPQNISAEEQGNETPKDMKR